MAWGDPSILEEIIGQSRDLPPQVARLFRRAAVQTGLVESGGRNLRGGDADSEGWRQERKSLYPNPRNVRASVARFKQEFLQHYDPGEKAWQVAAQVQRPAAQFRGRYHDAAREANQVLHSAMAGGGSAGQPGAPSGINGPASFAGAGNQPQGSEGILNLLTALQQPKQAAPSGGLQAPSFAAGPAMAGQVPMGGGGPAPKQDTTALLDAIRTVGGDITHAPGLSGIGGGAAGASGGGGAMGGGGPRGKVIVDAGANRAGVPLQPGPMRFAQRIAGLVGGPIHIGTGTSHNRLTVSGNVSDHWRGEGMDIPATGSRLVQLGQAALIAAGMPAAQARKAKGGAYRVGGKQIIFASNLPGYGDHTTHLHVGLSRRRG